MREVSVVHRDEHIVIVDKPAGLLVVPAPGRREPTVVDLLVRQLDRPVQAVHRLDEDTTGLLVLALDEPGRVGMEGLFRSHSLIRDYLALVAAAPSPPAGKIDSRLSEGDDGIVRVVATGGQRAITHYETVTRRARCTLVRCRLETGRRNQIRAHMAALGCPIAGDRKYGFRARDGETFSRVMLHSWHLAFVHPIRHEPLDFSAWPGERQLDPRA